MLTISHNRILLVEMSSMTTEWLILQGRYDCVDQRVNSSNFPMRAPEFSTVPLYLGGFSRTARTSEIEREVSRLHFRFACHRHLLILGVSHPRVCLASPIAALGSAYTEEFYIRRSAVLVSVSGTRELRTAPRENDWRNGWRFLLEFTG